MEDILVNIDSKYRDTSIYPNESKFRLNFDVPYKNIISAKMVSIELNNSINYIDSSKNNNFVKIHFPNKKNDPNGVLVELPRGLYPSVQPIQTIINVLFNSLVNTQQKFEKIDPEKYFYIFYLNSNVTISIDWDPDTSNLVLNSGWYSIYGLVKQIQDHIRDTSVIKNKVNFTINSFQLPIFDRRFRSSTNPDYTRIDSIGSSIFNTNNLTNNLNNLKNYIYGIYITDIITFITSGTGTGILDSLVNNLYVYPSGYLLEGSYINSSSKYHILSISATDSTVAFQLYNLRMNVDLTEMHVSFKNDFTDTSVVTIYYYYIDSGIQTWSNVTNTLKKLYDSNQDISKDIPDFEMTFNDPSRVVHNGVFDIKKLDYPSLGFYLGYRSIINSPVIIQTDKIIFAEKFFSLSGNNYIFIKINDWGHIDFYGDKTFAKILLTSKLGNIRIDDYICKEYKFRQPVDIRRIDIELFDYLGNSIDLNGCDFSFTLEFKQIINSDLKYTLEKNGSINNY
jgi:hypothetical protein